MAHSLSAKKRIRQNVKQRARNRWRKAGFRNAIKQYRETILHGTAEDAQKQLDGIYKQLDQVAAKGVIHRNAAARHKSRLSSLLNRKRGQSAAA